MKGGENIMKNLLKGKSGFTMVELMVVVIIVGILAAVSIPLYQANIKRAIRTEAEATLGSIRSAERIYKSEFNTYAVVAAGAAESVLGVAVVDAHYFDANCYDVTATDSLFVATCTNKTGNTASAAAQALKYFPNTVVVSKMDQAGAVTP